MDLTETVTASERIYTGRVVALRIDSVTLPDGTPSRREVVEHSGAVAVAALTEEGDVLLVRQFRLPAGGPLLEVPAGGIEPGEDPGACAARELAEEIGMAPTRLTPLYEAWVAPGYCTEKMYGFLAEGLEPAPGRADADEFVETVPMPLAEAIEAIAQGRIQDIKSIACLTLVARLRGL